MKIGKPIAVFLTATILFLACFTASLLGLKTQKVDTVFINEIVNQCANHWDTGDFSKVVFGDTSFSIVNNKGEIIYHTQTSRIMSLNEALLENALIVDVKGEKEEILGKILFENPMNSQLEKVRYQILLEVILYTLILMVITIGYFLYIHKKILRPFAKLQDFSGNIARGNFETPLPMDKQNIFGAFTESFDIMREELLKARESERQANQSKKELVASLSHDIKTPVSSIIALSEVMIIKSKSKEEQEKLKTIMAKAEQINALISDMFHATLEELQTLPVLPAELSSKELFVMIEKADYEKRINFVELPECMVLCDALRIQQVFDNIIGNSYKYADTKIEVKAVLLENQLKISFRDFGEGIQEEELPLVFGKFYRGKNSKGKNGAGLGLYISHYIMSKMGGEISAQNLPEGFEVIVKVKLA